MKTYRTRVLHSCGEELGTEFSSHLSFLPGEYIPCSYACSSGGKDVGHLITCHLCMFIFCTEFLCSQIWASIPQTKDTRSGWQIQAVNANSKEIPSRFPQRKSHHLVYILRALKAKWSMLGGKSRTIQGAGEKIAVVTATLTQAQSWGGWGWHFFLI